MKPNHKQLTSLQAGFTLVEVMVGLAIGMLATVIIMQVFSVFEAQKRSTTGTADAQTNGGIAMHNIASELVNAGYPLMPFGVQGVADSPLECAALMIDGVADATAPNRLSPAVITNGTSDSITFRYGDSLAGGISSQITGLATPTANDVNIATDLGCLVNDRTLIVNGAACSMASVQSMVPAAPPVAATITLTNNTGAAIGANLSCLGSWNEITYAVNNGNLERNGVPIVAGIVNLQAQYGISATGVPSTASNFNQVTQWVDATGGTWAAPTIADRNRIKVIRLAVVARNAKKELKDTAGVCSTTAVCSSLNTASPTGLCAWAGSASSPAPAISLGASADLNTSTDWQCYRYRVYETILPLRNVIWSKGTL